MLAKQQTAAAAAKAAEFDRVVQDKDRQLAAITAKNKAENDENFKKQQHLHQQLLQQQQQKAFQSDQARLQQEEVQRLQ